MGEQITWRALLWREIGSGCDGTDIRGGLLNRHRGDSKDTWEIRSVENETRTRVHIFQEKKKKKVRVISFQMSVPSLIQLKPACLICWPYIQHCATAKRICMPSTAPGPQSSSSKNTWTYGSNKRGSSRLFSHSDLKGYGQIETYKHKKNTFVPVYRLWEPRH